MGSTLTGTTIAAGYDSILKTTDNGPLTSTLKLISDGLGNDSPVKLSTDTFASPHVSYDSGTTKFASKRLEIGLWDMDATTGVSVAHGVTGKENVCVKRIMIIRDDGGDMENFLGDFSGSSGTAGGYFTVDATNIDITRYTSSRYDSTDFNDGTINRGYIWIDYVTS